MTKSTAARIAGNSIFACSIFACTMIAAPLAQAQDVSPAAIADFYRGKVVTIVAGSSVGGGLDVYARLVARHLSRFIPGNPSVVATNMPGAGSLIAAKHLYSIAPKDGTHIAIFLPGAIFDPLFGTTDRNTFDPTKLNYIGNGNSETVVCITRRDAPVKNYGEIFEKELVIGATGPGSTLVDYPVMTRNLLGAKLKIISGYKGSREVSLAIMQGELQGICGLAWSSAKLQYHDLFDPNGVVKVFAQEDVKEHRELAGKNIPLSIDFAKTPEQRQALELFYTQGIITRPFALPPGVPPTRVAAIRKAFIDTMRDPELQADAERQKTDAVPQTGEEVQQIVDKLYASSPEVIKKLKEAMAAKQ
jgi:tripartite-type tricarboxylate transporter receptor subunit TctC